MYSSFYLTVMTRGGKKTRYRASGTRSLFPTPIITCFKYIGPELHNETQRFSFLNKEKEVIQDLNYNLCFVDPSFGFVSIVLPSSDLLTSWIS